MQTTITKQPPHEYDSAKRGSVALEELRGLWQYRDLVIQLVRRDIVSRYKRSVLGIAWSMLNPLGMMAVLTIVFSQFFHSTESYPVYILSGLIAWNFFAFATSEAMTQIVWGAALLRRIYMPRTAFVVSTVGAAMVNLVLSLVCRSVWCCWPPLRWASGCCFRPGRSIFPTSSRCTRWVWLPGCISRR
jgi:ABC-type polysaccharide/polyol phosphate export permease